MTPVKSERGQLPIFIDVLNPVSLFPDFLSDSDTANRK